MVGSIGEVIAAEALGLTLYPMSKPADIDWCKRVLYDSSYRPLIVPRSDPLSLTRVSSLGSAP
jgi:hypothetical protein